MANPKCVSCDVDNARGKLLKCMHCICVQCLPQHITFESEVCCPRCQDLTPSPPSGVTHMQALPDSAVLNGGAAGDPYKVETGESDTKFCDECAKDEKAVATCLECQVNYCQIHADGHSRSRATYKHRMENLSASGILIQATRKVFENCHFHPTQEWQTFCSQCSQLLCQQCEVIHPTEHKPRILSLSNAASQAKTALHATFGGDQGKDGDKLDEVFIRVCKAIQDLHNQTVELSTEINEYFDGLVDVIRKKETKMLSDLDQLQSNKLHPLEVQKSRLGDTMAAMSTAKFHFKSAQPDANFMKMSPWLKAVARKEENVLHDAAEPCISAAKFVFSPNDASFTEALSTLGEVTDVAVQESVQSNVPNHYISTSKVSAASKSKEELCQSAVDCFNPDQCDGGITLAKRNSTAMVTEDAFKSRCVLGTTVYSTGKHDVFIRLDDVGKYILMNIGMTSNTDSPLDFHEHTVGLSVWAGSTPWHVAPNSKAEYSGDIGQPWKNGDVLRLHLDCQEGTLTARHERTGKSHIIQDVTGEQRLFVHLTGQGQGVTLVKI